MSTDLNEAKQRLLDKLGPNYEIYVQLLGRWFRGLISKEEFDISAKQLIKQNFILEHNKFWLAFFQHCANSAPSSVPSHQYQLSDDFQKIPDHDYGDCNQINSPDSTSPHHFNSIALNHLKVRCLPSKVITHMKIFVIAWEMGLDSANDNVSVCINLALQHFLKNIITELVCTKTAYRLRENRFKHAIGVKPINPYLNNSLKIYNSTLEYDPYQIESNKMNSSLVDTYAYNDSLFPSRLYEAQALYEYACSTTSVAQPSGGGAKRCKLSDLYLNQSDNLGAQGFDDSDCEPHGRESENYFSSNNSEESNVEHKREQFSDRPELVKEDAGYGYLKDCPTRNERRLTLFHLLMAFLSNRSIIASQSLYSINLERIFTKLSC